MSTARIVVIGASAGGIRALVALVSQLDAAFPAPILVVQHIGSHPSRLPELLTRNGAIPAMHVTDKPAIEAGRIYVAPPDFHMLIDGEHIRLSHAPKENHARPAIDPLFRSAAIAWGHAVIGVLLTGQLDDGTAGLQAIKRCGGVTVVQDPRDAEVASMPESALRHVEIDHVVPLAAMGAILASLARADVRAAPCAPTGVVHENDVLLGKGNFMEHLEAVGRPSTFVCPQCNGALWEVTAADPSRFRCHTGHGYTLRTLQHAQGEAADEALWGALRAMQEKEVLLRSVAESHRADRRAHEAEKADDEAREVARHAETLRALVEKVPGPTE